MKFRKQFPILGFLIIVLLAAVYTPVTAVDYTSPVPLPQLGTDTYFGQQGGLYPGGSNVPPPPALATYEAIAQQNAQDEDLVGACIGISMMQNACKGFQTSGLGAAFGASVNPNLTIINAAVGSTQPHWADPNSIKWDEAIDKILVAGYTAEQIDFILLHTAWAGPSELPFPDHAYNMLSSLEQTYAILQQKFPNIRIIYVFNRHYSYSANNKHPEPFAYDEAFAWKWLVEKWINGEIAGVPVAWGADQWHPNWSGHPEYYLDGLHLNPTGQAASALIWFDFWSSTSYIASWYLAAPPPTPTATPEMTATPTGTASPTVAPTDTPTTTFAPTPTPSPTADPGGSATPTPFPTGTATPVPTANPTMTPTTSIPRWCQEHPEWPGCEVYYP